MFHMKCTHSFDMLGMNTHDPTHLLHPSPACFSSSKNSSLSQSCSTGTCKPTAHGCCRNQSHTKWLGKSACQFLHFNNTKQRNMSYSSFSIKLFEPFPSNLANLILIGHFHHLLIAILLVIHGIPTKLQLFMAQPSSPNPRLQPLQECFQILCMLNTCFSNIPTSSSKVMEKHERLEYH